MGILGWMSQRFWFNKLGTRPRTLHFWQALRWFWDKCFANLSICLMWCLWDLLSTSNHNKKTFFCPCCLSFSDTSFSIKKIGNLRTCFLSSISVLSHIHFFSIIKCQFFFWYIFLLLPYQLGYFSPVISFFFFFCCYQKFIISLIKHFIQLICILNSPQRITDSYSECIYK